MRVDKIMRFDDLFRQVGSAFVVLPRIIRVMVGVCASACLCNLTAGDCWCIVAKRVR